jgi:hypothetical protein
MPKQQQERPTTPTGWEAWFVEWGKTGARRRGTVVATRTDAAAEWTWIQPRLKVQFAAAAASRLPSLTDASVVICVVAQAQTSKDGRDTWQEVLDDDRPKFAAPKLGALEPLKAPFTPPKPRAPRTSKAGAGKLSGTGGGL